MRSIGDAINLAAHQWPDSERVWSPLKRSPPNPPCINGHHTLPFRVNEKFISAEIFLSVFCIFWQCIQAIVGHQSLHVGAILSSSSKYKRDEDSRIQCQKWQASFPYYLHVYSTIRPSKLTVKWMRDIARYRTEIRQHTKSLHSSPSLEVPSQKLSFSPFRT